MAWFADDGRQGLWRRTVSRCLFSCFAYKLHALLIVVAKMLCVIPHQKNVCGPYTRAFYIF